MAWVRIDDRFADHPKVVAAGSRADWLYVAGLCYAARYGTDGFVPAGQVRMLTGARRAGALAERLVGVGLWEKVEGGYRVRDDLSYRPVCGGEDQPSAA